MALEVTSHPPIFAELVVNNPVSAAIVVMPLTVDELKVSPSLFKINPAPSKLPDKSNAPEYRDPPS